MMLSLRLHCCTLYGIYVRTTNLYAQPLLRALVLLCLVSLHFMLFQIKIN